ncbi:hypothetical protein Bca4012_030387 [Brassica carinata]
MVTSPSPTTQIGGIIGTTITTTTASESTRPVILVNSQDNGVRLVHALMACAEAVQTSNLMLAEALVKQIGFLAGSQAGAMGKVATYFAGTLARRIYRLLHPDSNRPFSLRYFPDATTLAPTSSATFLVWFGPTSRLTVADPDLIREIFSKSEFYEKNEAHPLVKQLEGDGLLSLKGEKWAHHRKIISPTFHMENLKLLIPVVLKSVTEMVEKWSGKLSETGEVEVDVYEWYQNLTEDVISRTAFGSSYEDGRAIFRLQAQQMILCAEAFQKVFIPGYSFFPTKGNLKSWKLEKEIRKSLLRLIEWRRKSKESKELGLEPAASAKDLLALMIQAKNVTVQDIVEECKSFFFAGKQTTSNLLTWTTILLAMHPEWQAKARDEVLRVCGSRDVPTKDHVVKLKTLGMILNESLRLYPPIVATIRRAKSDVELGGYKIPCGTELLIPIIAVHHDQAIWGNDVNEFNPDRFANGVPRAAKHPVGFIPFGLGARTCIGQNLAILQAKLTLAIMIQRFTFHLAPTYQHAPTVLMLLYPQHGAPITFRKLNSCEDR